MTRRVIIHGKEIQVKVPWKLYMEIKIDAERNNRSVPETVRYHLTKALLP